MRRSSQKLPPNRKPKSLRHLTLIKKTESSSLRRRKIAMRKFASDRLVRNLRCVVEGEAGAAAADVVNRIRLPRTRELRRPKHQKKQQPLPPKMKTTLRQLRNTKTASRQLSPVKTRYRLRRNRAI